MLNTIYSNRLKPIAMKPAYAGGTTICYLIQKSAAPPSLWGIYLVYNRLGIAFFE